MKDIEIWQGDCRELMKKIPSGTIGAVVTDPPYGTQADKDGYGRRHGKGVGQFIEGDSDLTSFAASLTEFPRLLAKDAWLAVFCSPKRLHEVSTLIDDAGFKVSGEAIWDKMNAGLGGGIRYQHESILLAAKGKPTGNGRLISVIRSWAERTNRPDRHPHEKPVDVMVSLVGYCSAPGELVLDPFAGTGTTAVACIKAGRRCIVIELDPKYHPVIERRTMAAETPLFPSLPA